jgi:hypothetical protein
VKLEQWLSECEACPTGMRWVNDNHITTLEDLWTRLDKHNDWAAWLVETLVDDRKDFHCQVIAYFCDYARKTYPDFHGDFDFIEGENYIGDDYDFQHNPIAYDLIDLKDHISWIFMNDYPIKQIIPLKLILEAGKKWKLP